MRRLLDHQRLTITSSPYSSPPQQPVFAPPSEKSTAAAANNNTVIIHPSTPSATTLNSGLNSSIALTILLLLSAFCFLGFCSIYIRRFAATTEIPRGRVQRRRPRASQGLEPAAIGALPLYAYHCGGNNKLGIQNPDCAVCLSEFEETEIVKALPLCGHAFHQQCIDVWLSFHSSCPLCRSTVFLPPQEARRCCTRVEEQAAAAQADSPQNRGEEEMGRSNSPVAAMGE